MAITQNEPDWPQFRKSLTGSGALYLHVFAEKFAELIVRECMDMVIAHEDDAPKEFHKLWSHMKQHFGVEE
jgi:hypothetical protein